MLDRDEKDVLFSKHCFDLQRWISGNLPTLEANDATSQLLSALPSIPIKSEGTFANACHRWLRIQQCLGLHEQVREELIDFLLNNLLLEDMNAGIAAALADLTENFHRFGGRTRGDFVLWAARRLQRHPDLRKYASVRDFINIGIGDFSESAASEGLYEAYEAERLRDFTHTVHGDENHLEYHVPIGHKENGEPVIWNVPSLDYAKGLWPVHAQKLPSGKYFVAKTVNGRHSVPVHRLKFNIGFRDVVQAYDGDFCNFCQILCVTKQQIFLGDWANEEHKKEKDGGVLKPAEGTVVGPVRVIGEEWIDNLHVSHDTWRNAAAQGRQQKHESTKMVQFIEVGEDGDNAVLEFGGWQNGSNPISTEDVVRTKLSGRNTPAWVKHDKADLAEGKAIKQEMFVTAIRDTNRDKDRARDGDVAGEERESGPVASRPSRVDDPE